MHIWGFVYIATFTFGYPHIVSTLLECHSYIFLDFECFHFLIFLLLYHKHSHLRVSLIKYESMKKSGRRARVTRI